MKTLEERFWEKVDKSGSNGCWDWTAATDGPGYGRFKYGRKVDGAHRISWEMHNGKIPAHDSYHGTCVLHKCDNRLCVNPDHLFLGTAKDNTQDMIKKNRRYQYIARGEACSRAKLTRKKVLAIRQHYGLSTNAELAAIYGVCADTIYCIGNKKTWKFTAAQAA